MIKTRHAVTAIAALFAGAWGLNMMDDANARAPSPLNGQWGGQQIRMQVDAKGAVIELGCSHGQIKGAIRLDKQQRFSTVGAYEAYGPGPQQGDAAPANSKATYEGRLDGDTLTLEIKPTSGAAESYTLTRGRNVKLIRCY